MKSVGDEMRRTMAKNGMNDSYQQLMDQVMADADVKAFLAAHANELTDQAIQRSNSKLYEFVHQKQQAQRGGNFAKGYQPVLVMNDRLIEVAYQPSADLQQQQNQRQAASYFKTIGMPKNIKQDSLTDYEQDSDRAAALEAALDFIAAYEQNSNTFHKGLYLYGAFGVGKTYLLGAIASRLAADKVKVLLVHFPTLAVEMKNAINNNQVGDKLDQIKKVPVLMIDDLGADSMSAWIRDDVLGVILEYRMANELPTFFSSNFSMEQLESEHLATTSKGDIEPLKAKRLMERIKFLSKPIEVGGKNRRNA